MLKVIPLLALVISAPAWSAELTIKVTNIKHEGVLYAAVYDDKEVFESDKGDNSKQRPGIVAGLVKKVTLGEAEGTIELEAGTYSIGFFIDKNDITRSFRTQTSSVSPKSNLVSQMMRWADLVRRLLRLLRSPYRRKRF